MALDGDANLQALKYIHLRGAWSLAWHSSCACFPLVAMTISLWLEANFLWFSQSPSASTLAPIILLLMLFPNLVMTGASAHLFPGCRSRRRLTLENGCPSCEQLRVVFLTILLNNCNWHSCTFTCACSAPKPITWGLPLSGEGVLNVDTPTLWHSHTHTRARVPSHTHTCPAEPLPQGTRGPRRGIREEDGARSLIHTNTHVHSHTHTHTHTCTRTCTPKTDTLRHVRSTRSHAQSSYVFRT